jgi:hypothetical protein
MWGRHARTSPLKKGGISKTKLRVTCRTAFLLAGDRSNSR